LPRIGASSEFFAGERVQLILQLRDGFEQIGVVVVEPYLRITTTEVLPSNELRE